MTETDPINIRPAAPDDAPALTALALRSKAHWGYDATFMKLATPELTVTPDRITNGPSALAVRDGTILGFYSLDRPSEEEFDLALLFVEPKTIGPGVGRRLFDHLIETARRAAAARLTIEADPYAEKFYVRMGATRIGEAPSGSIPGRSLPLLVYPLDTEGV